MSATGGTHWLEDAADAMSHGIQGPDEVVAQILMGMACELQEIRLLLERSAGNNYSVNLTEGSDSGDRS